MQTFEPADILLARTLVTQEMSEDCLYLNIWTPSVGEAEPLRPVLIYIYGNGFKSGTCCVDEMDGRVLAGHGDVVVVTFNYRYSQVQHRLSLIVINTSHVSQNGCAWLS